MKKKKYNCKHINLYPNHLVTGRCSTPYCNWQEVHCKDCGMFITTCGCHYMDSISGWSELRWQKYLKILKIHNPVKGLSLILYPIKGKNIMDTNGYPDDNELDIIHNWQIKSKKDCKALLDYIYDLWKYTDCGYWSVNEDKNMYSISTGGWSGNESLIGAMMGNHMFWVLCWYSSRRGGHYEFNVS
jgi:hypothetical protein